MSDKDFDSLFARQFEQSARSKPSNWTDLSKRLDKRDQHRRWLIGGILSGIFLLLGGGNIFFWSKWQTTLKDSKDSKSMVYIRDTVVHTTTIYQYDTIYKHTIVIQKDTRFQKKKGRFIETPIEIATDFRANSFAKTDFNNLNLVNNDSKKPNLIGLKTDLINNNFEKSNVSDFVKNDFGKSNLMDSVKNDFGKPNLILLKTDSIYNNFEKLYVNDFVKNDFGKSNLMDSVKNDFGKPNLIGLKTDFIYNNFEKSNLIDFKTDSIQKDFKNQDSINVKMDSIQIHLTKTDSVATDAASNKLKEQKAIIHVTKQGLWHFSSPKIGVEVDYGSLSPKDFQYSWVAGVGLGTEIELTKRLRLKGAVSYLFTKLQSTSSNTTLLANADISYPGVNYEFDTWSISKLPVLRYSAGVQYALGKRRQWQPYVVAGANGATVFAHEIKIDFKEKNKSEKKEVKHKEAQQKSELNAFYGGFGLNWQLSQRWHFQTEALYHHRLSKKYDWIIPQYVLKTQLLFEF
jgi:Outer membrane protein beta-barrel domain